MENKEGVVLIISIFIVLISGFVNNITGFEVNDCSKVKADYARADWEAEKAFASLNSDKAKCSKEDKNACRRLEQDYRNWDKTRNERNRLRELFKECKSSLS